MAPLKSSTRPSPSKPRLPCYVCTVPLLQPSAQSRQQWLIPGRAASAASNFYVDRGIPIISIPPRPDQAGDRARVSRAKSEQFTFRARFIARPPSELHHVAAHDGRTDADGRTETLYPARTDGTMDAAEAHRRAVVLILRAAAGRPPSGTPADTRASRNERVASCVS